MQSYIRPHIGEGCSSRAIMESARSEPYICVGFVTEPGQDIGLTLRRSDRLAMKLMNANAYLRSYRTRTFKRRQPVAV